MTELRTIRHELEKEIARQGYTLSSFSRLSGVNRGVLSATLNSTTPKPISINQLDQMSAALGKPEGWLYELFIEECFATEEKINWRRIRSLITRCVELQQEDLLERTLYLLLEAPSYTDELFQLAESLIPTGAPLVMMLYKYIIKYERHSHSERLAISHYRLFGDIIGADVENSYVYALKIHDFIEYLPLPLQLQAWHRCANSYYWVQQWDKMEYCADQMIEITQRIYREYVDRKNRPPVLYIGTERSFAAYYGQALLIKGTFYEHTGNYAKALEYAHKYYDLSYLKGLDEEGQREIQKLRVFAEGNIYGMNMYLGHFDILDKYVDYLHTYPSEIIPGLLVILTVANKYEVNIDDVLDQFAPDIDSLLQPNEHYREFALNAYYTNAIYQLALYQAKHKKPNQQLQHTLIHFESSLNKYNMKRTMDITSLLQEFIRSSL
ncbi:DNA-binding protein [Paenibacillus sp. Z6-24]